MPGLTPIEIERLIAEGETDRVEFKARLGSDAAISRVFSAFSNSHGGVLLIGVVGPGQVPGVPSPELQTTLERLSKIAASMLPGPVDIGVVDIGSKHVIYAIVERAPIEYGPILSSSGLAYQRTYADSDVVPLLDFFTPQTRETIEAASSNEEVNVFVAMSFRDEIEPHLQDYFKAMERAAAATELPLHVTRIDLVKGDYEISQEIMDQIDEADVLIADFTLNPSNVYFELGYARGRGIRVVQTARKETPLEFDARNWHTTFYRNATELEEKLNPELRAAYADVTNREAAA